MHNLCTRSRFTPYTSQANTSYTAQSSMQLDILQATSSVTFHSQNLQHTSVTYSIDETEQQHCICGQGEGCPSTICSSVLQPTRWGLHLVFEVKSSMSALVSADVSKWLHHCLQLSPLCSRAKRSLKTLHTIHQDALAWYWTCWFLIASSDVIGMIVPDLAQSLTTPSSTLQADCQYIEQTTSKFIKSMIGNSLQPVT